MAITWSNFGYGSFDSWAHLADNYYAGNIDSVLPADLGWKVYRTNCTMSNLQGQHGDYLDDHGGPGPFSYRNYNFWTNKTELTPSSESRGTSTEASIASTCAPRTSSYITKFNIGGNAKGPIRSWYSSWNSGSQWTRQEFDPGDNDLLARGNESFTPGTTSGTEIAKLSNNDYRWVLSNVCFTYASSSINLIMSTVVMRRSQTNNGNASYYGRKGPVVWPVDTNWAYPAYLGSVSSTDTQNDNGEIVAKVPMSALNAGWVYLCTIGTSSGLSDRGQKYYYGTDIYARRNGNNLEIGGRSHFGGYFGTPRQICTSHIAVGIGVMPA